MVRSFDSESLVSIVEGSLNEIYLFAFDSLRFVYVNDASRKNLGYTKSEFYELTPLSIKPYFTEEVFREMLTPLQDGSKEKLLFETVHRRKDGTEYAVEVHLQAIRYRGISAACALILDIEDRKQLASKQAIIFRQAQEVAKMKNASALAAGIAHEINNCLASIMSYTDLARCESAPGSELNANLNEVLNSVQQASEISREMLAYSGKGKLSLQMLSIEKLITDVLEQMRDSLHRDHKLEIYFSPDLPSIEADSNQIRRVFSNLIRNALDAIGQTSGLLRISAEATYCDEIYLAEIFPSQILAPGDYVIVRLIDEGVGMSEETLNQAFEPFFTTKPEGRGLGLSVSQGIALIHNGGLRIYSEQDRGTSVLVFLPAVRKSDSTEEIV